METYDTTREAQIAPWTRLHVRRMAITADAYRNSRERESVWTVASIKHHDNGVTTLRFARSKVCYQLEGDRLWSQHRAYEIIGIE